MLVVVRAGPGGYVFPPYSISDTGEPLHRWLGEYPSDGNRMFLQCGLQVRVSEIVLSAIRKIVVTNLE